MGSREPAFKSPQSGFESRGGINVSEESPALTSLDAFAGA